ncbi:PHD finger protein ING1 isoform X2 [Prosopis cineraria]|uniref:PHD finger protein ING1 isoform X2 n=1 Tax=Prosopis cineraria TaxID=364024 RepID=UPI0024102CD2|nr:PHD finger protein ING1 isoform X2 [Prosopis cineraria]
MKHLMSKSTASGLLTKKLPWQFRHTIWYSMCIILFFDNEIIRSSVVIFIFGRNVDTHIQQLDQYLKKFDEEFRRERENAATTGVPASGQDGNTKSGRGSESGRGGRKKTRQASVTAAAAAEAQTTTANPAGMDLDLPVDPNEPTYCFCNQVSYGEMVACDNPNCKIEWFHFGCVGLKEQPKGKWYCSDCAATRGRRKGK